MPPAPRPTPSAGTLFDCVVAGIDDTTESLVAAAQARCLAGSEGSVSLVAVAETHLGAHAGFDALRAADTVRADTERELRLARRVAEPDETTFMRGSLAEVLVGEAERRPATLVAIGVQPHNRLLARLLGGRDKTVLQGASCSVLVARPGWGPRSPERILVGVDGSPASRAAEEAARALAARLGCPLTPVIALGDGVVDGEILAAEPDALLDPRPAVEALTGAPADSLVVVGCDEDCEPAAMQVAHEAQSSVLVVRSRSPH